jgi:hypothetical protein
MDDRQLVYYLFDEAMQLMEINASKAHQLLTMGRNLAEKLEDPCLILDFDRWICGLSLWYTGEYHKGLDQTVRAVIESRKPRYDKCSIGRLHLLHALTDAYISNDPLGYEQEIRETVEVMEKTMSPPYDLWCLMQWTRAYLELVLGNFDHALTEAQYYLERSQRSEFRSADACALLAEIYFHRKDWLQLEDIVEQGIEYAQRAYNARRIMIELLAWQTFSARLAQDEAKAQKYYAQTQTLLREMDARPSSAFYDAICAYHEYAHDYSASLQWRDQQLQQVRQSDSPFALTECYLRRLQLFVKMGRPIQEERAQALIEAQNLVNPERFFLRLSQF